MFSEKKNEKGIQEKHAFPYNYRKYTWKPRPVDKKLRREFAFNSKWVERMMTFAFIYGSVWPQHKTCFMSHQNQHQQSAQQRKHHWDNHCRMSAELQTCTQRAMASCSRQYIMKQVSAQPMKQLPRELLPGWQRSLALCFLINEQLEEQFSK